MASQKVCHYEKYGYCKMKDDCLYFHPKVLCEKEQCDVKSCRQRHPQICKFFALGACKFLDTCRFNHSRIEDNNECKLKIIKLEEKMINFRGVLLSSLFSKKTLLLPKNCNFTSKTH